MHEYTYALRKKLVSARYFERQELTSACWSIGTNDDITVITTGEISWRT